MTGPNYRISRSRPGARPRYGRGVARRRVWLLLTSVALVVLPVQAMGQGLTDNSDVLRGTAENDLLASGAASSQDSPVGASLLGPTAIDAQNAEADTDTVPPHRRGPSQGLPTPAVRADGQTDASDPFSDVSPADLRATTQVGNDTDALDDVVTGGPVRPASAVDPVQSGPSIAVEDDPYAPVGIRVGTFVLRPTIDLGIAGISRRGFDEDGDTSTIIEDNEDGIFSEADLRLNATSDWSRHALSIDASARWQEGLSGDLEGEPSASISATARIDISAETTVSATAGYSYTADDVTASQLVTTDINGNATTTTVASGNPSEQTINGRLTLAHDTGGVFGSISGGVERSISGTLELDDGTFIARDDPDNTLYDARLRAGFTLSPVFRPFAEVEVASRVNDDSIDANGFARDSLRTTLRAGSEIDLGEKLSGELAIGYLLEDIEDDRLADIEGVSIAGELNWSPIRGTDVGLTLATTTNSSSSDGVSGSVVYAADAVINQQLRRNLSANAGFGIEHEVATGPAADSTTLSGTVGFVHWFNRYVGLVGDYTHERVLSDNQADEQTSNSVFLGLRLQR